MFHGKYNHTIDTKGRLSIPSEFRDVLRSNGVTLLMVTNFILDGNPCLDVYPEDEWKALEAEVGEKDEFDPVVMDFQTYYVNRGKGCELDSHGRILIPPELRKYAELKRDVVLESYGKKFRIWDEETGEKRFKAAEARLRNQPNAFSRMGLFSRGQDRPERKDP